MCIISPFTARFRNRTGTVEPNRRISNSLRTEWNREPLEPPEKPTLEPANLDTSTPKDILTKSGLIFRSLEKSKSGALSDFLGPLSLVLAVLIVIAQLRVLKMLVVLSRQSVWRLASPDLPFPESWKSKKGSLTGNSKQKVAPVRKKNSQARELY